MPAINGRHDKRRKMTGTRRLIPKLTKERCGLTMDKIKVIITNKQKDIKIPTGLRMLIRRCCNAVLKMEQFEGSVEVSVTLVNNKQIKELNGIYRNKDRATDVLSFPLGENGKYDTYILIGL